MKTSKHCLSRKCMLSLAPQRLINIEIISVVSELLSTRQKNKGNKLMYNWFLPVLNAQQTVCGEGLLQKWVEEHVSINQEIMELRTYERIIIPVSHGFAHWYLLVVSVQEHCAEIWDPVPSSMMSNIFVTEVQKIPYFVVKD